MRKSRIFALLLCVALMLATFTMAASAESDLTYQGTI